MMYLDGGIHDGVHYHIQHNGDFSGSVQIIVKVVDIPDSGQPYSGEVDIPMDVIRRIVAREIMTRRISRLEDMSDAEILFGEAE